MIRGIIKIDIDWIVEIEGHHSEINISMDRIIREDHTMSIIIEMTLEETILEKHKINCRGQNFRGGYRRNYRNKNSGRGRRRPRDRQCSGNFSRNDRSSSSRSRSCLTKDCPNLEIEKEPEQIQQMYNLDEEQTALKVLATDTHDNLTRTSLNDTVVDHLNL